MALVFGLRGFYPNNGRSNGKEHVEFGGYVMVYRDLVKRFGLPFRSTIVEVPVRRITECGGSILRSPYLWRTLNPKP